MTKNKLQRERRIATTVTSEAPVTKYNTGSRNVGGVGDSVYRGTFQKLGRGRKSQAVRVCGIVETDGRGMKRERRRRKRTREHELVTWLDENEPAENGSVRRLRAAEYTLRER